MNKFKIINYNNNFNKELIDFNIRISNSKIIFSDPLKWQFAKPNELINQEFLILIDNQNKIRAITAIKNQKYLIKQSIVNFQDIQLPVSESVVNSNFIFETLFFLKHISNISENMHALGMGGVDNPLPKILNKNNFKSFLIPFFIFPLNLSNFISLVLFNKFKIKINSFLLLPFKFIDIFRLIYINISNSFEKAIYQDFEKFDTNVDLLWEEVKINFDLIAVKNSENLNFLYSNSKHDLKKYNIFLNNNYLGFIILKITKHNNDKYFRNTKTLTIVDLLCNFKYYKNFIRVIKKIALINNCDIVLMNTSFCNFNKILIKSNFFKIPSNYGFSYKTKENFNTSKAWMTRADGDGPINL